MELATPRLYTDWRRVPEWLWREVCPSFHPLTDPLLCSPDNGSLIVDVQSFASLQLMRDFRASPQRVNSGYRTPVYNARLRGSSPRSMHARLIAFDLHIGGIDRHQLKGMALEAGFTGIGMYETFIHVDRGRRREWYGSDAAKALWKGKH